MTALARDPKLSTSIYDLMLIYVCHFHLQPLKVRQNTQLSRYLCILDLISANLYKQIGSTKNMSQKENSNETLDCKDHIRFVNILLTNRGEIGNVFYTPKLDIFQAEAVGRELRNISS